MVAKNDITGDKIQTKTTTKEYRDGWDAIFGKWEREEKRSPCCGHDYESTKCEEKEND